MGSVIIYKSGDGSISVIFPVTDAGMSVEGIAAKDVPAGSPFAIMDAGDLPDAPQSEWVVNESDLTGGHVGPILRVAELPPPPLTRLYKADIWRRATSEEAARIDAILQAQEIRFQRMWADSMFLSTKDELFPMIKAAATEMFGADRAAALLQPTE